MTHEKRLARLRVGLLKAQHALAATKMRLVVLVGGVEGGGEATMRPIEPSRRARGGSCFGGEVVTLCAEGAQPNAG